MAKKIVSIRIFISIVIFSGILSLSNTALADVFYTYDNNGRVTSALYDTGVCIIYVYDANGNRLSQTTLPAGSANTPTWGTGIYGCFKWSS